jgi:hypothetical protein
MQAVCKVEAWSKQDVYAYGSIRPGWLLQENLTLAPGPHVYFSLRRCLGTDAFRGAWDCARIGSREHGIDKGLGVDIEVPEHLYSGGRRPGEGGILESLGLCIPVATQAGGEGHGDIAAMGGGIDVPQVEQGLGHEGGISNTPRAPLVEEARQ